MDAKNRDFFDALEIRTNDERASALETALPAQIAHAKANTGFYHEHLASVQPEAITDEAALADLPITRKSELMACQADTPPFGGLIATPVHNLSKLYLSPGPIADPEAHGRDWWRVGRALFAAGLRAGHVAHNCFSYHHTPAGAMFETGAHAVGCPVYPGGVGATEQQVEAIAYFKSDCYMGTPDFLGKIFERAEELGVSLPSLKMACVGGGPLFPAMREAYEARGVRTRQMYGAADLGLIAYESEAMEGMIIDEHVIVEIVRPGTGDPVALGEVGEVVVTSFNADYPLIRFATGDLSAFMPGISPCGRTNKRIKGWMGRADQRTKVKGMFVDPVQIDRVVKAHDALVKARVEVTLVDQSDVMVVKVETENENEDFLAEIAETVRIQCKLRAKVEAVKPGSLPNDGKVIDDKRDFST